MLWRAASEPRPSSAAFCANTTCQLGSRAAHVLRVSCLWAEEVCFLPSVMRPTRGTLQSAATQQRRLPGTRRLPQVLFCTWDAASQAALLWKDGGCREQHLGDCVLQHWDAAGTAGPEQATLPSGSHADLRAAPLLPALLRRMLGPPEKSALACFRWKGTDLSQRGLWLIKRYRPQAWCSDQIKQLLVSSYSKTRHRLALGST